MASSVIFVPLAGPSILDISLLSNPVELRARIVDSGVEDRVLSRLSSLSAIPLACERLFSLDPSKYKQAEAEEAETFEGFVARKRTNSIAKHILFARVFDHDYICESFNLPKQSQMSFFDQSPVRFVIGTITKGGHSVVLPSKREWKGVCGGSTHYFALAALKIAAEKGLSIDEDLLRSVAEEFADGAPDRSIVVQQLLENLDLIGMFAEPDIPRIVGEDFMAGLDPGFHRLIIQSKVRKFSHALMLYIPEASSAECCSYGFDPNIGLIRLKSDKQLIDLVQRYAKEGEKLTLTSAHISYNPEKPIVSFILSSKLEELR